MPFRPGVRAPSDQFLALTHIHKAAADEVGAGEHLTVVAIDGSGHDDDAVLRQMMAVTQDHVADIADTVAVHHHSARRDGVLNSHAVRRKADVLAVLSNIDVLPGDVAQVLGRARRGA